MNQQSLLVLLQLLLIIMVMECPQVALVLDGGGDPARCDGVAAHVEELYRASAERTKMTDGEIADNVAMVLSSCRAAPDRVVACVGKATAVTQLESQCLPALDDEGTEGEQFRVER